MEQTNYTIPLRGLANGNHSYSFDCGDELFTSVENALADGCKLHVDVAVHKTDQMMTLDFAIVGTVRVQCSVCLGSFDYPIEDCEERITVKFGDHYQEEDDNLYMVDELEERLDLGQWIYELSSVMIPIHCEHPLDEQGNTTCDPAMLDELNKYLVTSDEDIRLKQRQAEGATDADSPATDPRWDALKGLLDGKK